MLPHLPVYPAYELTPLFQAFELVSESIVKCMTCTVSQLHLIELYDCFFISGGAKSTQALKVPYRRQWLNLTSSPHVIMRSRSQRVPAHSQHSSKRTLRSSRHSHLNTHLWRCSISSQLHRQSCDRTRRQNGDNTPMGIIVCSARPLDGAVHLLANLIQVLNIRCYSHICSNELKMWKWYRIFKVLIIPMNANLFMIQSHWFFCVIV